MDAHRNAVAWSLCQILLGELAGTDRGPRREAILTEILVALEHIAPNVEDVGFGRASQSLRLCGLEHRQGELGAVDLAGPRPEGENHQVSINATGPRATFRYECSCGQRGIWHERRGAAEQFADFHVASVRFSAASRGRS